MWSLLKAPLLKQNQIYCLRSILWTGRNTPAAEERAETGIHSIYSSLSSGGGVSQCNQEDYQKCLEEQILQSITWINQPLQITSQLAFSTQYLVSARYQVNTQTDTESLANTKSLKWLAKNKVSFQTEKCLTIYLIQYNMISFIRARFEQLDFIVKYI